MVSSNKYLAQFKKETLDEMKLFLANVRGGQETNTKSIMRQYIEQEKYPRKMLQHPQSSRNTLNTFPRDFTKIIVAFGNEGIGCKGGKVNFPHAEILEGWVLLVAASMFYTSPMY
jgi:hypothetical protein